MLVGDMAETMKQRKELLSTIKEEGILLEAGLRMRDTTLHWRTLLPKRMKKYS
jgi:hypothetical protein